MSNTHVENPCEQFKALLVEHGEGALAEHDELARHVDTCAACQRLLRAWNEIPELLEELPEHEPQDALVAKVRGDFAAAATAAPGRGAGRRFLAPSLASAAVLLAAFGISYQLMMQEKAPQMVPADLPQATGQLVRHVGDDEGAATASEFNRDELRVSEMRPSAERLESEPSDSSEILSGSKLKELDAPVGAELEVSPDTADLLADRDGRLSGREIDGLASNERAQQRAADKQALDEELVIGGTSGTFADGGAPAEEPAAPPPVLREYAEVAKDESFESEQAKSSDGFYFRADNKPEDEERKRDDNRQLAAESAATGPNAEFGASPGTADEIGAEDVSSESVIVPGFDFLAHYQRTDGLTFQPATGYWANSYVPGDPQIRLLSARLAEWDRSWLPDPTLERAVQPISQPFDAPEEHALALSVMADAAALPSDGTPTRLRVQVGIQGIEHRRGTRPAMNLAMVIDIPPQATDKVRIAAGALLDALLASKQAGDRFALVLTGQPGHGRGLVLTPEEFRFGSLRLAKEILNGLDDAFPGDSAQFENSIEPGVMLDPLAALKRATELVRSDDDPEDDARPIGSSSVLLLTARELPGLDDLTALAHANARDGITLSVVPLGNGASNAQAEQLVLAGLGQRRYLEAPAAARELIENELHAASQAVARAARLSIRLAPGIQLVDVIGSERLDSRRAQRVRDIENAMDRRLDRHLGIQADRGEDEEGIQMVIPSIYAGDALTVLLDVVAEGPGPVAEVTLRYKDLVYRRNGTLHGHLELPRGELAQPAPTEIGAGSRQPPRGPGELSVLKNLLAHHFTSAVEIAAESLGNGQPEAALEALREIYQTYEWLRLTVPALKDDADLIRDQNVLERYMEALRAPGARENAAELADSLRLAAWAKTHGQPETWQ